MMHEQFPAKAAKSAQSNIYWTDLLAQLDARVVHEVAKFHHRGSFFRAGPIENRRFMRSTDSVKKLMAEDLRLTQGGATIALPEPSTPVPQARRSPERFVAADLALADVSMLFHDAFRADAETGLRPYPSGGRLYPIDVVFVPLSGEMACGPYHYLHRSHAFEILPSTCMDWHTALLGPKQPWGTPSGAIVYVMNLPKSVVKYRYRGYRIALMEAGCMMQAATLAGESLGWKSRVTNAFSDTQLTYALGLHPASFLPLAVHLIGRTEESSEEMPC